MLSKHKKYLGPLLVIIFALLAAGLMFASRLYQFGSTESTDQTANEQPQLFPSINGTLVEEEKAQIRPIAVMIENSPEARPQAGLANADIVYEALAEGGITRFVALYQTQQAKKIGPVRSARDYFASIADEYSAVYTHVGGSDEVLAQLNQKYYKNLTDFNEYYNGAYFERIKTKPAPHNVFTSSENIAKFIKDKGVRDTAKISEWMFTEPRSIDANPRANNISINFSSPAFKVGYEFDSTKNEYKRTHAGIPHLDSESKQQLTTKTIIVQFVSVNAIAGDAKDRIDVDLSGKGQALIFHDGTVTKAKWTKSSSDRTIFTDETNNPIQFNRGQIWVELVPDDAPNTRVTWKPLT